MQGLLAGINAARSLDDPSGNSAVVLRRDQAYAGVLVDDLVLKGTDEPYRMFTSRAEHRLLLREDNASARLLDVAARVGLADAARVSRMRAFEDAVAAELSRLGAVRLDVTEARNALLTAAGGAPMREPLTLLQLLRRPEVSPALLLALEDGAHREPAELVAARGASAAGDGADRWRVLSRVEVEVKYAGYIERAQRDLVRDRVLEDETLPDALFNERLPGISHEVHEKLARLRPRTLGQASRISGVTPAALGLLAVEVRRRSAS